jgi:3-dehydroquinate synthase
VILFCGSCLRLDPQKRRKGLGKPVRRLQVESERGAYKVIAEAGASPRLTELLEQEGVDHPRSVVSNTTVGPLWADAAARDFGAPLIELADGEEHKRWSTVEGLLGRWLDEGLHRGDSVLAIGGGVLTDTVGFAAAIYLRGIDWIAVPTTLLAMVDASVGGKTGVNLDQGKNLVGAFWPPRMVVIDVETLRTLPTRELRAGLAEVIKTAWIGDHDLLELFTSNRFSIFDTLAPVEWEALVMRCVAVKARVVSADERETGRRAALNLGHTLGHALEAATGYRHFLHGEAVAWGLLAAAKIGRRHSVLSSEGAEAIESAVASLGPLPSLAEIDEESVRRHIGRDKKRNAEGIGWVLPTNEGVVVNQKIATEEALEVFQELKQNLD